MIRRIPIAIALFLALAAPGYTAGTISLSGAQQFNAAGKPLAGCKLYFYEAGTVSTRQDSFKDSSLTTPHSWPLECDSSGRIPFFYLADGTIKIRLADRAGVTQVSEDGLVVVGASSGGGGGGAVDSTKLAQTGDIKVRYGTGALSGWVRAAGRTIGSATSGATERANSDTQDLWEYLCSNDTTLRATIAGGYSGNCANDYAANKTIQLPDYRGYALAGLGDMGNSATSGLTSTYFGTDPTVLGAEASAQSVTFAQANLPNVNFLIPANQWAPTISMSGTYFVGQSEAAVSLTAGSQTIPIGSTNPSAQAAANPQMSAQSGGSGTPFSIVGRFKLATIYIKL